MILLYCTCCTVLWTLTKLQHKTHIPWCGHSSFLVWSTLLWLGKTVHQYGIWFLIPSNGPTRCRISSEEILGTVGLILSPPLLEPVNNQPKILSDVFPWLPQSNTERTLSTFFSSCARRNYHGTSIPPAEVASELAFISSSTYPTSCKMENAQGGRKHLPKSKQPFYKRNNNFEFEASLQSLENELITALMAKIDNEEMKQGVSRCPTIAPFLPIWRKEFGYDDSLPHQHIDKISQRSEESRNGGGQVWLWHRVPHQEPVTDGLSPLISPHRDLTLRGRHASFSHTVLIQQNPGHTFIPAVLRV